MHRELLKVHIIVASASGPTEEISEMLPEDDRLLLHHLTTEKDHLFIGVLRDDVYTNLAQVCHARAHASSCGAFWTQCVD